MHEKDEFRVPERLRGRVGNRASVCAAVLDRDELDDLTTLLFPPWRNTCQGHGLFTKSKKHMIQLAHRQAHTTTQPHASFHHTHGRRLRSEGGITIVPFKSGNTHRLVVW